MPIKDARIGGVWKRWRPRPELNRGTRFCRPLRNHSATWPHRPFSSSLSRLSLVKMLRFSTALWHKGTFIGTTLRYGETSSTDVSSGRRDGSRWCKPSLWCRCRSFRQQQRPLLAFADRCVTTPPRGRPGALMPVKRPRPRLSYRGARLAPQFLLCLAFFGSLPQNCRVIRTQLETKR